ncbi:DUF1127 domain-containing protein [Microvirga guangxiensis]|uniref:YjiS-like domain-containing protein n=1 Tax=Microvirga guangxiensis TaxID=549386 RepID=A0A1G5F8I8_9HYPH|nr:DUF1127 domain-containing protein [Microvirga guangxiensis]SCY35484.1 protein of unknown function [Microvirga guangxiensis]
MSALSTTRQDTFETRPTSGLRSVFSAVLREIRIRRAMKEVAALDEATLHDIGIGPGNIEDAIRHGRC